MCAQYLHKSVKVFNHMKNLSSTLSLGTTEHWDLVAGYRISDQQMMNFPKVNSNVIFKLKRQNIYNVIFLVKRTSF